MGKIWLRTCTTTLALLIGAAGLWNLQAFGRPKQPVELPAFTTERETAALRFIAEHHPELGEVLARLKTLNREQYEQAIRQLSHERDKLTNVQPNDEKLYELMLEAWKVNSRIEVLAARIANLQEKDPKLEAQLKDLLFRQVDLHRLTVEHNRERTLATLKVMEANIKHLQENREEIAERRFRQFTSTKKAATTPDKATPPKK
jgi:hypothetical protein